jgi:RNA polymerase sigma-70 factor (ECF subfamily)
VERLAREAVRSPRAFAALYDQHVTAVFQYCYRRLGNREMAEDVTSQIFIKALTGMSGYDGRPFRSWLFAIAHNAVVDAHRRRRPTRALDAALDVPDRAPTPEEHAIARDERQTLSVLLAALGPDQRAVVELRLAGLNGAEIGAVLERSPGAIKALHHRALTRLRGLLGVELGSRRVEDDHAR